jgi:regulator of RNase E activity RraB
MIAATELDPALRFFYLAAGLIALVSLILLLKVGRPSPLHEWTRVTPVDVEPETQAERDAATIQQIRMSGADMGKLYRVDFFLIFKDQASSERASEELKGEYDVTVSQDVHGKWWCTASFEMLIYETAIADHGKRMLSIARKHGGHYDGWGASIEPREISPDASDA